MTVLCRCGKLSLLWDSEADDYSDHLIRESIAEGGDRVSYRCPATGRMWIAEFGPDHTGALSLMLKRLMPAPELVAFLAADPRPAVLVAFADPHIEFRPPESDTTFRGVEQVGIWSERTAADPRSPQVVDLSMVAVAEDEVLVLGTLTYRCDNDVAEQRPAAWLITVRGGHLVRSVWFDSWERARAIAGLPRKGGPPARRLGSVWSELATKTGKPGQHGWPPHPHAG